MSDSLLLKQHWCRYVRQNQLLSNLSQDAAVDALAHLGEHLRFVCWGARCFWWHRLGMGRIVYLWGGVGRGKTMIMDFFIDHVGQHVEVVRLHYHDLMDRVQREVHHSSRKGKKGRKGRAYVLDAIVRQDWRHVRLLCLDEIAVRDITDAMLFRELVMRLIRRGVSIVLTANVAPEDLYLRGLQRESFLPFMAWLREHAVVVSVEAQQDYRRKLIDAVATDRPRYVVVDDLKQQDVIGMGLWRRLTSCADHAMARERTDPWILPDGRHIAVVRRRCARDSVSVGQFIWFDASVLDDAQWGVSALGKADMLHLAKSFEGVMITGLSAFDSRHRHALLRLVTMIDILYDQGRSLLVMARVPFDRLLPDSQRDGLEVGRLRSRLDEMTRQNLPRSTDDPESNGDSGDDDRGVPAFCGFQSAG